MKFFTKFERPETVKEVNSGELLVEVAGYVPAKKQIENLLFAGKRLDEFRRHEYEFQEGEEIPPGYIDLTRTPNFDPVDAGTLTERFEKKKQEIDKLNAEKAAEALLQAQEEEAEKPVEK